MWTQYRARPNRVADPVTGETVTFVPTLLVRVNYPPTGLTTKKIIAVVDSGSPFCYFHPGIGRALKIDVEKGIRSDVSGIASGASRETYFHDVVLHVAGSVIHVPAGFVENVTFDCLLGRNGFFDNFKVTFDQTSIPPRFLTEPINRPSPRKGSVN